MCVVVHKNQPWTAFHSRFNQPMCSLGGEDPIDSPPPEDVSLRTFSVTDKDSLEGSTVTTSFARGSPCGRQRWQHQMPPHLDSSCRLVSCRETSCRQVTMSEQSRRKFAAPRCGSQLHGDEILREVLTHPNREVSTGHCHQLMWPPADVRSCASSPAVRRKFRERPPGGQDPADIATIAADSIKVISMHRFNPCTERRPFGFSGLV